MSQPKRSKRRGWPRVLDDAKRREICALVSAGAGLEAAAGYVGHAPSTVRREAHRDPAFDEALRHAMLTAELAPLNALRQAATRHWRAAAWMLERVSPHRYTRLQLRPLKPEHFRIYGDKMIEALREEIDDPAALLRAANRLDALGRRAEREAWLAERDSLATKDDKPGFLEDEPKDPPDFCAVEEVRPGE